MNAKKHLMKIVLFLCLFMIVVPMVTTESSAKVGDACAYCGHKPFLADPYDVYGKCEKCKKDYDYQSSKKSVSGIFVTNKEVKPSSTPYGETKVSYTIPKGEVVTTVASYINAKGNLWYEVRYGDNKTGYIYEENIDLVVKEQNIYSVSGSVSINFFRKIPYLSAPSGNGRDLGGFSYDELEVSKLVKDTNGDWWYYGYSSLASQYVWVKCVATMDIEYTTYNKETNSIIKGSNFPSSVTNTSRELNYEIKTSKATISQVSVAIYSGSNTNGTLIMGGGLYTVNATSTNIKSNAGKDIYFQKLTPGQQYTLQISVKLIGDKYYDSGAVKDYTYTVSKTWTFTVACSHSYSSSYTTDSSNHWKVCTICGAVGSKSGHSLTQSYDGSQHWKTCSTCGYTTSKTNHSFSTKHSDTQHWQECSCGYKKSTASHSMSSSYQYDGNKHWKECSSCDYTASKASHSLTTNYDSDKHWSSCSCGYSTSKTSHTLTNQSNASYHWQACSCGHTTTKVSHTLTNQSDASYHWQACSCGYTTTKISHTLTNQYDASYHWQVCSCGYTKEKTAHVSVTSHNDKQHWSHCGECSYQTTATDHLFGAWEIVENAEEGKDGIKLRACRSCDYTETATFSVVDHIHAYIPYVTLPSCTENGYTTYRCSCGDSYIGDQTEMLGHVPGNEWHHDESNHWNLCARCKIVMNLAAHERSQWIIDTEADDQVEGSKHIECLICKCILEDQSTELTIHVEKESEAPSFMGYVYFVLDYLSELFDSALNKMFSSEDIYFFREHKYAAGIVSTVVIFLAVKLIFGTGKKKRK